MKTGIIIQARTSSSRLPGKVLEQVGGEPLVIFLLNRLTRCKRSSGLVLATSLHSSDDLLASTVEAAGFDVYRGDLDDVLGRYAACAKQYGFDAVVRVTGDCPLLDAGLVDEIVSAFEEGGWDYLSNGLDDMRLTVPDGYDLEVFSSSLLFKAALNARKPSEREHVTSWMRSVEAGARCGHFEHNVNADTHNRLTVDDPNDLRLIRIIISCLSQGSRGFSLADVTTFLRNNPEIASINMWTERNAGYRKSLEDEKQISEPSLTTGVALWEKAKKIIPGGNMLLSKRAEMYLPGAWPAYFSRAKGCEVWDLDGNRFIDMCVMGVGTNVLGYGNPGVDAQVVRTVSLGNMSTLNCPEEVMLAESLIEMHPWADMCRLARTGGEANSIAIRIARAASGRDKIAVCGYHGWHDWYLAANLNEKSQLDKHLLPGLEPKGVPVELEGTVLTFEFNDIEALKKIFKYNKLAAVKMEVERSSPPTNTFLTEVRELCNANKTILIFDECTSGFRETLGGLHKKYKVNPDMAVFGKALGNGYAITAVIGRDDVMQAAQDSFISSTFWTERIGPTAANATLELMRREQSWEYISDLGSYLSTCWAGLAKSHDLSINLFGISAIPGFSFNGPVSAAYKTLISQEMLKKGMLASTIAYMSTAHTKSIIDRYIEELDPVFGLIAECESGRAIDELLSGEVSHSGFKRLN